MIKLRMKIMQKSCKIATKKNTLSIEVLLELYFVGQFPICFVCLKIEKTPKPNGFHDHYPY
jgi:hypothetical protein